MARCFRAALWAGQGLPVVRYHFICKTDHAQAWGIVVPAYPHTRTHLRQQQWPKEHAQRSRLVCRLWRQPVQARQSFLQLLRLLRAVFTLDTRLHTQALVGLYGPWLDAIVAFGQHCSSALGPAWAEILQQVRPACRSPAQHLA